MAKVAVFTIGCKVNQGESEELKMALAEAGHTICGDPASADLCVVNTCTVTAESDRKCRKLIRWLGRRGAGAIVAAGCYAQVNPGDLGGLPGVVRVLPNTKKDAWAQELEGMLSASGPGESHAEPGRTRGLVKVQDGCERRCSYCIVPMARGRERSRPLGEVLELACKWLNRGTRELVLCGVNLGRYNLGPGFDLSRLVREVTSLGDDFRVRLSSIELEDLKMSWLQEWSGNDRVCPHLHLPLQSGDEQILKDMGRGYRPEDFLGAARDLRSAWPGATLTTEIIVGYPGESGAAFRRTVEVLREVRPSRVHVFRFSPRPGTPAWNKKGKVAAEVMETRSAMLRALAEMWRVAYAEERVGELRRLLVERVIEQNGVRVAVGTTEDYIKASLVDPPLRARPGCLIEARIYGVSGGRARLEWRDKRPRE
jgi:threonylcarbamoyladenosine tRNA methylthiotransferase MtaB